MIALDTNLLVYSHRSLTKEHRFAQRAIERASSRGIGIALPTFFEFWSIVTHANSPGRPSTPEEVCAFFSTLQQEANLQIWHPTDGFAERLSKMAISLRVQGIRIFDFQIASIAFESGAEELWTHDNEFLSVPGLKVYDPI